MAVVKIKEGVYSVGVLNPGMRIFDVVMRTDFGTSYNSYLITGEKNVLIDTVHARYFEEHLDNIASVIDPASIDYIVMNHNEPDHSGSLAKLAERIPGAQIITSPAGKNYLAQITNNSDLNVRAVKDGETLALDDERSLTFLSAPFLHWPDSMLTWMESAGVVFTCDFLGCHYCEPRMLDSKVSYPAAFERAFEEYFDGIFKPFAPYVQKGLAKLNELDAEYLCPSHGPILTKGVFQEKAKARYHEWSWSCRVAAAKRIAICYCSAYGNTGLLAERIAEGIHSVLGDAQVGVYDANEHSAEFLQGELDASDAFLLGSPTINKDAVAPVWSLACGIDAIGCKGKPASAFGSYGWSGEAVPGLLTRLRTLKMDVFEEGYTCRFVPSESELSGAFEFGARFATAI